MHPPLKGYLALTFAMLAFALQPIALKIIINPPLGYSGLQIAFIRQALAVFFMAPVAGVLAWRHRHMLWQHRMFLCKGGILGLFLHGVTFNTGLEYSTALNAYIISSVIPVCAVILSIVIYKKSVSYHTLFYVAISILGALVIIAKGDISTLTNLQTNIGDIFYVLGAFIWAGYGLFMANKPPEIKMLVFTFIGLTLSSIAMIPVLWVTDNHNLIKDVWTLDFMAWLFFATVIVQIFALLAYSYATTVLDGIIPAITMNILPLLGSLLAIVTLGEVFYVYHGVAVVLMGISVYNMIRRDMRKRREQQLDTSPNPKSKI